MARHLVIACGCLLSIPAGCAYAPIRASAAHPQSLPAETAAYYDYPVHAHTATVTFVRERGRVRESLVQFPLSAPEGFQPTEPLVEFEWFESTLPGRRPAIVFNPILGGDYPLERGVCRYFAHNGFHVALVHRKTLKISPEHSVDHLELLLRQGIMRIRQIVDWMAASDRVDPNRLGSFGISMGGMATTMAAAVEPRLRIQVVALAGGSLADIISGSHDTLLTKPRRRYLERNHMGLTTMTRLLQEHLKTDPILLAPYVDNRRLFMVIALADRTIGASNALRLWRALGRPEAVFLPFGHYTSYLALPYIRHAGLRFFQKHL